MKRKDASSEEKVSLVSFSFADIDNLVSRVETILSKTIVSKVIERLRIDSEVNDWVDEGLKLHQKKSSAMCLFCERPLLNGHLDRLEGHFNDEYKQFISEIESLIQEIANLIDTANNLKLPNKAELCDDLRIEYRSKCDTFEGEKREYVRSLGLLKEILVDKKKAMFKVIKLDKRINRPVETTIDVLNEVIEKHNKKTENFVDEVNIARVKLENCLVAQTLAEVLEKEGLIEVLESQERVIATEVQKIQTNIADLERDIVEHRRPADDLNKDLAAYLGRKELTFEIKEKGYQILRNGTVADGLSEGEKTAIAFLYFLKSLEHKDFKLENGIVVIDDPVSSLDANSLFYVFGFMKERANGAGQLFILTHNFCFFRQAKNWFTYINNHKKKYSNKEANFYMLECEGIGESRQAKITALDKLLADYESEYHYLFSLVYKGATSTNKKLEQLYHLPNVGRRLLEAFLAFRKPSKGNLYDKLACLEFDNAKKVRILRFLQTHSHSGEVDDPEHDVSILSETPEVLKNLLDLIKYEDPKHYAEMETLCGENTEAT